MFKIRKYILRNSLLSNGYIRPLFEDLENNNWISLDTLGNIYEIYVNLAVMTLLHLDHLRKTQVKSCLKGKFVKASFMFVAIFFRHKTLREKTLISLPAQSI